MRSSSTASRRVSLALIGTGLALVAYSFAGQGLRWGHFDVARAVGLDRHLVPEAKGGQVVLGEPKDRPRDTTLKVTIPEMSRVDGATVPDAASSDTQALTENAAIHLAGTGFPWEEGANVYLAGHRVGYPGTNSFLAFHDQAGLENGDEITVADSAGKEYVYRVFEEFTVEPEDIWVTGPVPGKSVLTLQTCTLPSQKERLITRAELVEEG